MLNSRLSENILKDERNTFLQIRDSLYKAATELKDRIKVLVPEYANLLYPETVTSEQVQSILNREEVLVAYFTGDLRTFAFIQTSKESQVIDLGSSDDIRPLINQFKNDFIPQQKSYLNLQNTEPLPTSQAER